MILMRASLFSSMRKMTTCTTLLVMMAVVALNAVSVFLSRVRCYRATVGMPTGACACGAAPRGRAGGGSSLSRLSAAVSCVGGSRQWSG